MKIEDLNEYKKKLSKLSSKEKKLREEYLMKFHTGEYQGPGVGYPSIDMPQLGDYDAEKYFKARPRETVAEALVVNNLNNRDSIALDYFGNRITYGEFNENANALTKALVNYGVRMGDYVGVCAVGMPESMYSIQSNSHLGSTGIYLAPYLDHDTMLGDIKKGNTKILMIMDLFYKQNKDKFDKVIEEAGIEHVIIIPTLNSSKVGKFIKNKKYKDPRFESYNDFIKKGRNTKLPKRVDYIKDMPLAVVYSSGTTGVLKGVLLSNDSFINSASSYVSFGFNLSKGQIVYQAIPLWSSTGLIADGFTALYYGCTLYQNPKFDPKVYSTNLGKHKINWGVATTELFNGLVSLKDDKKFKRKLKRKKLSYSQLENIYIGGTFSTPKDKKRLTEVLRELGCNHRVNSSYGTCENGSIVTAELDGREYPDYSVGKPIPGASVMIIDEDCNELQYNQRGEISVKTDCGMLRYFNRPDLDGIFFKEKTTGEMYKHTGDMGYITPDGVLIYEGRKNDYSDINGKKIYNFDVKRAISEDEDVFDCEVFSKFDNKLYANIIFYNKDNMDLTEKFKSLQKRVLEKYGDDDYVPELFKVSDSFPMASSTKRDYAKIKNDTEGYQYICKNPKKYTL